MSTLDVIVLIVLAIIIVTLLIVGIRYGGTITTDSDAPTTTDTITAPLLTHPVNDDPDLIVIAAPPQSSPPCEQYADVFPYNEANSVIKPYLSSIAQCHLGPGGGIKCTPIIRNVRWREPLEDMHVYDAPAMTCTDDEGCIRYPPIENLPS